MRLIAWNVNGFRAIMGKNFPEIFQRLCPDIMSLDEIKLSTTEDPFPFIPEGYEVYYTISKIKKGYSGVAVFTKIHPVSVHYGFDEGAYDEEGRVVTLEYDNFYYVGVYSPNVQEQLTRLPFRVEFESRMRDYLSRLATTKPVIMAGDLNVAHQPIDLKRPKANEGAAGFTKEERENFSWLLEKGFVDSYRYLYPEKIEYSWWSYRFNARKNNTGWRIDYFIVSDSIKHLLKEAKIHGDIYGSDHCPVSIEIDL